jgi:uncharacterized protein (TIGR00369 family)
MSDAFPMQSKVITWVDLTGDARPGAAMSGREVMDAMIAGALPRPPFAQVVGTQPVEAGDGRMVFRMVPESMHYNPQGVVHGGALTTLADSAMACAIITTLLPGELATTLELKINFVRAVTVATGPLRCEGLVVHRGGTIATAEGRVTGERDGKLYAHASTTCMILRPPPES